MDNSNLQLKPPPRFATDAEGNPTEVRLDAAALARLRQIEADCIAQHGEFDWEKLPEAVQDEYDDLCALLDQLQDNGERISLKEYERQVHGVRP